MTAKPRILLAWELGGALGHVTKFMVLAERLLAQGCEVWIASQNLTSAEAVLGHLDVHLVQSPIWLSGPGNIPEPINYAGILARKGWLSAEGLTGLARGWRDLVAAIAPHLIVANHAPSLLLALRGQRMPILFADSPFGIPPLTSPFPNMRYWQSAELVPVMHDVEARVLATSNQVLDNLRQPPLQHLCDLFEGIETCLLGLPELDHYPERGAADYYGPLYAQHWGESPVWPSGQGKRVFVYLDAHHPLLPALLDHLTKMPCQVLAYIAHAADSVAVGRNKANIAIRSQPQHMGEVLTQADWIIHHAGNGLASQALQAGVPLLMLPNHLEQSMFAVRVGELRLGKVLPNDAHLLGPSLRQVLEDSKYVERAKQFAASHVDISLAATLDRLVARCLEKTAAG